MPDAKFIDLSGTWSLASEGQPPDLSITLPGDVHSALQARGVIPDPYFGANEAKVQWVAERDWTVSRTFRLEREHMEGHWYLDLDFVDTVATVRINGQVVLESDNCFRRYRPDVTGTLLMGENVIEVVLQSPIAAGRKVYEAQPFEIPWTTNCPIPYGNMLRKPQCHFGWDWNIALAPSGLYGRIALRRMGEARIEHVLVRQEHKAGGAVDVEVSVTLFARETGFVPVRLTFDGVTHVADVHVHPGETVARHRFEVAKPKLWWPAGSGEQHLYDLEVEVAGERETRRIGLRRIELLTDKDEAGSRFAFRVNGEEIFCRGANWIPADALFSRTSPEKSAELLRSAVEANMNMIRIWGGGFYEHDWFYDLCDRLGLLVWQDFMFACNLYPSTTDFLDNVAAEAEYQVRRLQHHASIALWCGDNELVGALNWFEPSIRDRDRYLVSYDRLNRTIEQALRRADPEAIWWPSSPSCGYLNFGDAWHADGSGDMHFWSVWHENKSFDHYRAVTPRFCSEFGFQSYTSNLVIRTFAEQKDLNIASPVMEVHQKNPGGNERIAGTMFRHFRFPRDFDNFVYLSQVQQALAIRTAVEYWRSLKPHCMGTLVWQLNDTWPVASWSSLDYGGNWKVMHYLMRRFFAPTVLVAVPSPDGSEIRMVMVNDLRDNIEFSASLYAVSLDGSARALSVERATCRPDKAMELARVPASEIGPDEILVWDMLSSAGTEQRGHFAPRPYKAYELEPPGLGFEVRHFEDRYELTVTSRALALFVTFEADVGGRFSDNVFDMLAGETRTVTFIPKEKVAQPSFVLRDLHSCQATG